MYYKYKIRNFEEIMKHLENIYPEKIDEGDDLNRIKNIFLKRIEEKKCLYCGKPATSKFIWSSSVDLSDWDSDIREATKFIWGKNCYYCTDCGKIINRDLNKVIRKSLNPKTKGFSMFESIKRMPIWAKIILGLVIYHIVIRVDWKKVISFVADKVKKEAA